MTIKRTSIRDGPIKRGGAGKLPSKIPKGTTVINGKLYRVRDPVPQGTVAKIGGKLYQQTGTGATSGFRQISPEQLQSAIEEQKKTGGLSSSTQITSYDPKTKKVTGKTTEQLQQDIKGLPEPKRVSTIVKKDIHKRGALPPSYEDFIKTKALRGTAKPRIPEKPKLQQLKELVQPVTTIFKEEYAKVKEERKAEREYKDKTKPDTSKYGGLITEPTPVTTPFQPSPEVIEQGRIKQAKWIKSLEKYEAMAFQTVGGPFMLTDDIYTKEEALAAEQVSDSFLLPDIAKILILKQLSNKSLNRLSQDTEKIDKKLKKEEQDILDLAKLHSIPMKDGQYYTEDTQVYNQLQREIAQYNLAVGRKNALANRYNVPQYNIPKEYVLKGAVPGTMLGSIAASPFTISKFAVSPETEVPKAFKEALNLPQTFMEAPFLTTGSLIGGALMFELGGLGLRSPKVTGWTSAAKPRISTIGKYLELPEIIPKKVPPKKTSLPLELPSIITKETARSKKFMKDMKVDTFIDDVTINKELLYYQEYLSGIKFKKGKQGGIIKKYPKDIVTKERAKVLSRLEQQKAEQKLTSQIESAERVSQEIFKKLGKKEKIDLGKTEQQILKQMKFEDLGDLGGLERIGRKVPKKDRLKVLKQTEFYKGIKKDLFKSSWEQEPYYSQFMKRIEKQNRDVRSQIQFDKIIRKKERKVKVRKDKEIPGMKEYEGPVTEKIILKSTDDIVREFNRGVRQKKQKVKEDYDFEQQLKAEEQARLTLGESKILSAKAEWAYLKLKHKKIKGGKFKYPQPELKPLEPFKIKDKGLELTFGKKESSIFLRELIKKIERDALGIKKGKIKLKKPKPPFEFKPLPKPKPKPKPSPSFAEVKTGRGEVLLTKQITKTKVKKKRPLTVQFSKDLTIVYEKQQAKILRELIKAAEKRARIGFQLLEKEVVKKKVKRPRLIQVTKKKVKKKSVFRRKTLTGSRLLEIYIKSGANKNRFAYSPVYSSVSSPLIQKEIEKQNKKYLQKYLPVGEKLKEISMHMMIPKSKIKTKKTIVSPKLKKELKLMLFTKAKQKTLTRSLSKEMFKSAILEKVKTKTILKPAQILKPAHIRTTKIKQPIKIKTPTLTIQELIQKSTLKAPLYLKTGRVKKKKVKRKKRKPSEELFYTPSFSATTLGISAEIKNIKKYAQSLTGLGVRPMLRRKRKK